MIAKRAHLPAFKSLSNVELQAVADVNETAAKAATKNFGIPKFFTNYKEMLNDPSIDLVSICVPSPLHAEVAIEAAKKGKHILVEKPLALTVRDAQTILHATKENNVKLCVVHNYRYFPAMQEIKRRIDVGNLGQIVTVHAVAHTRLPLSWTPALWLYKGGGALDDFGPHLIDAILWLNGTKVKKVCALGGDFLGNMNCINYIQVLMEFENKAVAVGDISWVTDNTAFTLNIHGTGGRIFADIVFNHFIETHGSPTPVNDFKNFYKKMDILAKGIFSGKLFRGAGIFYKTIISQFINSIESGTDAPISGEEGLAVVAVSEAAKISLAENRFVMINELFA